MTIVEPRAEIIDTLDGAAILKKIEYAARTCYQSRDKMGDGTAERLIANCIQRGHESVLEHVSVSVRFVTDRGIHNELVRHRLTSVSCESTRYCNYRDGIEVIKPLFENDDVHNKAEGWQYAMEQAEASYQTMINDGATPQEARSVLPLSLKCEYIITANLREWRHILRLRTSPAAHPECRRVLVPLLEDFKAQIPVVFDDIQAG